MSVAVVNWGGLTYQVESAGVRYEAHRGDLAGALGMEKLRVSTLALPPGKADGPYRFHLVNEHMLLVLGGRPSLRLGGVEYPLSRGDVVALPARPSSAHQLINRDDRPVHVFVAGTNEGRDVIGMPDSNKRIYRVRASLDHGADAAAPDVVLQGDRIVDPLADEPADAPLGPAPPAPEARDPRIAALEDVPWQETSAGPFRSLRRRLGGALGSEKLGYSLYRVEPGQRPWPFHFHHANEEFFSIRSGFARLRAPWGERELRPGDAFACLAGPAGAHAIHNAGDGPLEYFALSTMIEPEVVEYPDSDKTAVMVGAPPGGDAARRRVDLVFRRQDAVAYEEGER